MLAALVTGVLALVGAKAGCVNAAVAAAFADGAVLGSGMAAAVHAVNTKGTTALAHGRKKNGVIVLVLFINAPIIHRANGNG